MFKLAKLVKSGVQLSKPALAKQECQFCVVLIKRRYSNKGKFLLLIVK